MIGVDTVILYYIAQTLFFSEVRCMSDLYEPVQKEPFTNTASVYPKCMEYIPLYKNTTMETKRTARREPIKAAYSVSSWFCSSWLRIGGLTKAKPL